MAWGLQAQARRVSGRGFLALCLACVFLFETSSFVGAPLLQQGQAGFPPAQLGTTSGAPRAHGGETSPRAAAVNVVGALVCGSAVAALLSGQSRPVRPVAGSRHGKGASPTAMKAESILGRLEEEDAKDSKDQEQAKEIEQEMETEMELSGDTLEGGEVQDVDAVTAARRGERQVKYELRPSKHYVLYVARKNAEMYWAKPGVKGEKSNKGCLEVQIALITEKIRNSILHVREFNHDYLCRWKLVSMVSKRRKMLDKLSWKDLDSYLRIRDELKIRHTYRMEVLIGRLGAYKYGLRDRKKAPGRVITMRMKKSQRLLQRRLATQLRQGKPSYIIHKTKKKIKSRKWLSKAYDDTNNMIAGKPTTDYVDPLNIP